MGAQHGGAGSIEVTLNRPIQRQQGFLPALPLGDVIAQKSSVVIKQASTHLFTSLRPTAAKAERQNELPSSRRQVDLAGKGDVAVLCPLVDIRQLKIAR